MTHHYFDPATGGFFDRRLGTPPTTAQPITAAQHAELLAAQAAGAVIVGGAGGRPRAQAPSAARRRDTLARAVRIEAARRIEAVSPLWRQLNDLRAGGEDAARRFGHIDAIRAASDLIVDQVTELPASALAQFAVRDHPLWPEF